LYIIHFVQIITLFIKHLEKNLLVQKLYNRLQALANLDSNPLSGGLKGIEKESLRVTGNGSLAMSDHPIGLGSALTNNYITTDFSEALLEFVTPASKKAEDVLSNLIDIHKFSFHHLDQELLWPASMPCHIPPETKIPLAKYGFSNIGQMKTIYRRGLGNRYGRHMQMISGIHFNYSLPQNFWKIYQDILRDNSDLNNFKSEQYLGLIRNFKRIGWLVLYLFGASPALCKSFSSSNSKYLKTLKNETYFEKFSTSLRMSDLGYNNQSQSRIDISLNSLEQYINDLGNAIHTPEPLFKKIGVKVDNLYRQLNTNLLQIENEYYSSIRPKRVAKSGERPTAALMRGGIEYIEVRSLDLNFFEPCGIDKKTILFMEALLIYCLLTESPKLSIKELKEISSNHTATAHSGRDPLLNLIRGGTLVPIKEWSIEILNDVLTVATELDKHNEDYVDSVKAMKKLVDDPDETPSAKMLSQIREKDFEFSEFALEIAKSHHKYFMTDNKSNEEKLNFYKSEAIASMQRQKDIELSDTLSLDDYLQKY